MKFEKLDPKTSKYSDTPLYKNLQTILQECPGYFKDFLNEFSCPLLTTLSENELLKKTDLLTEFLTSTNEINPENVLETLYLIRFKTLPILNNQLFENEQLKNSTKKLLSEQYQSIYANLEEIKENFGQQEQPLDKKIRLYCTESTTILNFLGHEELEVNNHHDLDS